MKEKLKEKIYEASKIAIKIVLTNREEEKKMKENEINKNMISIERLQIKTSLASLLFKKKPLNLIIEGMNVEHYEFIRFAQKYLDKYPVEGFKPTYDYDRRDSLEDP